MGRLDELGDAVRQTIRAFHGSPYDFDRFDASKIGTGEGAQSYGHGLYFAGNEGVARTYRDDLSRNSFLVEGAKTPWTESTMDDLGVRPRARVALRMAMRDGKDPIDRLLQAQSGHGPLSAPWNEYQDAIELLRGAIGKLGPNKGRMYEVEIGHPESALLDYDAPMSEQPAAVRKILGDMSLDYSSYPSDALFRARADDVPGGEFYHKLAWAEGEDAGLWSRPLREREGAPARLAAEAMRRRGIPGIRYLDQGSRAAGDGTRNYVIFPGAEDSIRILRKFAVPGAVGVGAASVGGEK